MESAQGEHLNLVALFTLITVGVYFHAYSIINVWISAWGIRSYGANPCTRGCLQGEVMPIGYDLVLGYVRLLCFFALSIFLLMKDPLTHFLQSLGFSIPQKVTVNYKTNIYLFDDGVIEFILNFFLYILNYAAEQATCSIYVQMTILSQRNKLFFQNQNIFICMYGSVLICDALFYNNVYS